MPLPCWAPSIWPRWTNWPRRPAQELPHAQNADLTEAIKRWKDAITRIDKGCDLLQDTFDRVNGHFSNCSRSCSAADRPS
jgi:hypothetical protein